MTLRKDHKMLRKTPKIVQFCDDSQKYQQNIHTPKIFFFFLKPPKNIDIQTFEPPKNCPSLRIYENIRVPPPLGVGHETLYHWYHRR